MAETEAKTEEDTSQCKQVEKEEEEQGKKRKAIMEDHQGERPVMSGSSGSTSVILLGDDDRASTSYTHPITVTDADLEANITADLWVKLTTDLEAYLTEDLGAKLTTDLEANLTVDLEAYLRADLGANVTADLEAYLTEDLRAKLTTDLEANLTANLEAYLRADVGPNVTADLEACLTEDLGAKLTTDLEANLTADLGANVTSDLEVHVPNPTPLNPFVNHVACEIILYCLELVALSLFYMLATTLLYAIHQHWFTQGDNVPTINRFLDGFYFSTITFATIGFGDFVPSSVAAKILMMLLILVGSGYVNRLLDNSVDYLEDLLSIWLNEKWGIKFRCGSIILYALGIILFGLSLIVVVVIEKHGWIDALYLTIISFASVGYGDYSFKTKGGRLFAAFTYALSTFLFGRFFTSLSLARIACKRVKFDEWLLTHKNEQDNWWPKEDQDREGRKAMFILYKLKQMNKLDSDMVDKVTKIFDELDPVGPNRV